MLVNLGPATHLQPRHEMLVATGTGIDTDGYHEGVFDTLLPLR